MYEWKVVRVSADNAAAMERTLNDFEKDGLQVVHIIPQGEFVLIVAKRKK